VAKRFIRKLISIIRLGGKRLYSFFMRENPCIDNSRYPYSWTEKELDEMRKYFESGEDFHGRN